MTRNKNFVPKITEEEFKELQPRCKCPCNQLISWKEHYKWHGIPRYMPGHSGRTKSSLKTTKEEFEKDIHYCTCGCRGIIFWKEHYRRQGTPLYLRGHRKDKQMYFLDVCSCGCNGIVYGNRKYVKGHQTAKKYSYEKEFNTKPKYCMCGCGENITWKSRYATTVDGDSQEANYLRGHYNIGKKFSEEHKDKISISNTGKAKTEEQKKRMSEHMLGRFKGENHPNWKGGISFEPYCSKYNNVVREESRNKYNRCCLNCNRHESENIGRDNKMHLLSTHHIYYNKQDGCNGNEIELVLLCMSCHSRTGKNREYWQQHLKSLINFYHIRDVWSWFTS